ncbi:MAG TPA: 5-(carboxyamino)imidazole ribonucleotide synthase [Gammaproteobacteria bacterium]|nr:5-(carboxyamino)imidazole ribonucleotide synthase [Gammaproteobacteria bacterium]
MDRKRVGIVGAGQLGRMLALAGYPIGVECRLLDRSVEVPAAQVAWCSLGDLDDPAALAKLAQAVDVVTLEIENVAVAALESAAAHAPVFPPPAAVGAAQDRLAEKTLFRSLGIPTVEFVRVDSDADLDAAAAALGWPLVLKTRRLGYDGRGQRVVDSRTALSHAWVELGRVPCIAEAWVPFDRELSLIAVQGARGERAFYPLAENVHRDGILASTVAPYDDTALQRTAEGWLTAIMAKLEYRGVLTVEFFHTGAGLIANEMAPRVHNSGHWTIEGAETSQFENHLRAVVGWPLGDTQPRGHAGMLNVIGQLPDRAAVLAIPGAHLHDYGKTPRPGRKIGHCTLVDPDRARLLERLEALRAVLAVAES